MCCIVVAHTLHDCYSYMDALQNRGREAAGIAAVGDKRIDVLKWKGLVKDFGLTDLHKIFPDSRYHLFLGHIRYATKGRKSRILEDAHPHTIGGTIIDKGSHIHIRDCDMAIVHKGQVEEEYLNCIDKSHLHTECDSEALLYFYKKRGEYEIIENIPGAYTLAIADKRRSEVIVMRDRTGIRPGTLGAKGEKHDIVSEDIALRKNGAKFIENLQPGYIYYISPNGDYRKLFVAAPKPAHCFFEWNYLSHVDSILDKLSSLVLRQSLGEALAEEIHLPELDWMSFVPRCPEVAGKAYANLLNLLFFPVFYKMKTERAFQGSTIEERERSIRANLHLIPKNLFRQTGALMEDSIVRGTNAKRARKLLFEEAGVQQCYLLSYTPPLGIIGDDKIPRGCMFGIDMPPEKDNFIAREKTVEQIIKEVRMPVHYLSIERMLQVFEKLGMPRENLCTYCIGGEHPFKSL